MIRIRNATPADANIVSEFNARLARETEDKQLDPEKLMRGVTAVLAQPDIRGRYFLAQSDGKTVGQLSVTYEWSDWRNGWFWWLQSVYVVPEARRIGVFSTLYEHVAALAKAQSDVLGLRLYVLDSNQSAQATYKHRGMQRTGYEVMEIDFSEVIA